MFLGCKGDFKFVRCIVFVGRYVYFNDRFVKGRDFVSGIDIIEKVINKDDKFDIIICFIVSFVIQSIVSRCGSFDEDVFIFIDVILVDGFFYDEFSINKVFIIIVVYFKEEVKFFVKKKICIKVWIFIFRV